MKRSVIATGLASALLAGAGVLSALPGQTNPVVSLSAFATSNNVESTSLYCVGISSAGRTGTGGVKFWNSADVVRHLDIHVGNDHGVVESRASIAPHRALFVPAPADLVGSVSVRAQIDGSGVVGSLFTTTSDATVIPCQSQGVVDWYVAGLSTATGNSSRITLVNPSATPAVVDVSTQSSLGFLAPAPYQGLVVPANGQLTLRLGEVVVDANALAVHVSALRGSIVASALYVNGTRASVLEGQSTPATDATYASLNTNADAKEVLNLYNPTDTDAHAKIAFQIPGYQVAPLRARVNAQTTLSVTLVPDTRVPTAGWGILRVTSANGIVSTLLSSGSGYLRLASPVDQGTTLAWTSGLKHGGKVRVAPVDGKNVTLTFTYFDGRRRVESTMRASAGEPVNPPQAWIDATYGFVSANTPLVMQGVVGTSGLESGLNGR